jgi:hypothetical protein
MSNQLSRFSINDLDFGRLDQDDELYKKARPATRVQMELGRYTVRVMPGLREDAFMSGGFPWITVWQHGFRVAGKDNLAVCPRMHSRNQMAPCPFCEEAEMGNSDMVAKRQAIANLMVLKFAPRGCKPQDVQVFEHPKVLPWNVPGGIIVKFREWIDEARLDNLPLFFDVMRGNLLDVTKSPKPNARDPKRDVQYSIDKKAQCPISDNQAVVAHFLEMCQPLAARVQLFDYDTLKRWHETGERPANDLARAPKPEVSAPQLAPAARRPPAQRLRDTEEQLLAQAQEFDAKSPSDEEDLPF